MAKTLLPSASSSTRSRKSPQSSSLPKAPANLWEQVDALNNAMYNKRPGPEWFTAKEYKEHYGLLTGASERLYRMVQKGQLEISRGRPAYFRVKR